jgi:hypothetical protein
MEVAEYVQNITFRLLQPTTPRPSGFRSLNNLARKAGIHLEMWMTRLPEDQEEMQRRLTPVCKVPRMSTFAIGAIINRAVALMPDDQSYLNIGVWNGFTLLAGMASNPHKACIGVDNFSHKDSPRTAFLRRFQRARGPKHQFREGDFREYFAAQHTEKLGLYLFDGPHTYEDQLDGLQLAEPFFAPGCLVLVDDTNWPQVRDANLDFIKHSSFEYRMLLDMQTPRTGHPTYWNGLMLFQRGKRKSAAGVVDVKGAQNPRRRIAA